MDNLTCDIEKVVRYKGSHKSGGFYLQKKRKGLNIIPSLKKFPFQVNPGMAEGDFRSTANIQVLL